MMTEETKEMFVGIDTSKHDHQVSFLNQTNVMEDLKVGNDRSGFEELTEKLNSYKDKGYQIKVACEPTGHYWENLGRHLKERDFFLEIVNPYHTSCYKELMDNSPQKDDKKDSRIISQLIKDNRTLHENLPKKPYAELRELTHLREDLLKDRNRLKNKLHKWLDRHFPEYPKLFSELFGTTCLGLLKEYRGPEGIKEVDIKELSEKVYSLSRGQLGLDRARKIKNKAAETIGKTIAPTAAKVKLDYLLSRITSLLERINQIEKLIKDQLNELEEAKYLESIPGVGWWGAAVFLGEVGDPTKMDRAEAVVKLAGLNLYRKQSGQSKSGLSITRRGRSLLRKVAYQLAVASLDDNQEFTDYYQQKLDRGKEKQNALVALSAKVLRVMYGVVKNGETYRPLKERETN